MSEEAEIQDTKKQTLNKPITSAQYSEMIVTLSLHIKPKDNYTIIICQLELHIKL